MAICFLNENYEIKYRCSYELKNNGIKVYIEKDMDDEVEEINGCRIFTTNQKILNRNITIIDYDKKENYKLMNAYFSGMKSVFGTLDAKNEMSFFSELYFISYYLNDILLLKHDPKIQKIKFYSDLVNEFIGYPSFSLIDSKENTTIKLLKENSIQQFASINLNYIEKINVSDDWERKKIKSNYEINLSGYIELIFSKKIKYDELYDYAKELIIYMQLLMPDKFRINKIIVSIESHLYELVLPINEMKYEEKSIEQSVKIKLIDFLENCYKSIPYAKGKRATRNIPFIILNKSRNIEDNFLMFYRFVECYYKSHGIVINFISHSINNCSDKLKNEFAGYDIQNLSQEIICLRNHYVHSGYHIKGNHLKINFDKNGKNKNPNNYVANVSFDWIYKRTKILYSIVIDIIFKDMLNYTDYIYNKHF